MTSANESNHGLVGKRFALYLLYRFLRDASLPQCPPSPRGKHAQRIPNARSAVPSSKISKRTHARLATIKWKRKLENRGFVTYPSISLPLFQLTRNRRKKRNKNNSYYWSKLCAGYCLCVRTVNVAFTFINLPWLPHFRNFHPECCSCRVNKIFYCVCLFSSCLIQELSLKAPKR